VAEVVGVSSAETDENVGFLDVLKEAVDSGLFGTHPRCSRGCDSANLVVDRRKNHLAPVWGMRVVAAYLRRVEVLVDGDVGLWE
jgi:hypothetical protein